MIFTRNNVEAKNGYTGDLKEILQVAPKGDIEAKDEYGELEKPDVEFSRDMKFLNVTLKDSIILAIYNNYDIKIAKLDPMIKEKDVTVAKSKFDPILKFTGKRDVNEIPTVNELIAGLGTVELTQFKDDKNILQATIEKPIETGAKFTLDFETEIRDFIDPAPFRPLNPESESSIEVKITQPLLKGAGIFYNRSKIYIARNDKKKSILQLKEKAIEVINSVQNAYWDLVMAIEELRVRNKSLESAEDLLRRIHLETFPKRENQESFHNSQPILHNETLPQHPI